MNNKISSLQCAYEFLKNNPGTKTFYEIWNHVVATLEIENPDERVSTFYTNLLLDGRFVTVVDNENKDKEKAWDLRERNKLEDYYSDTRNYYYTNESENEPVSEDENENGEDENGENAEGSSEE